MVGVNTEENRIVVFVAKERINTGTGGSMRGLYRLIESV